MKAQMKTHVLSLEVIQTISAHCRREAEYQNQMRHLLSEIRNEVINQSLSKFKMDEALSNILGESK
jgi:predicted N-formylglutamate amidohydrolase